MTDHNELAPARFVDAHVHHWDPANLDWYPHLAPDFDVSALGVAGADAMKRRYLAPDYLADARPWNLNKYVHVNTTSGPKAYLAEAEWLAGLGGPLAGVIGTVDLEQDVEGIRADLTAHAGYPLFRGVRNMVIPALGAPELDAALEFLAERRLVYDFVVHPATMARAAEVIARHPDLDVVVDHVGWPTSTDAAERRLWRTGMARLATLRENVTCKISGIAMAVHTMDADVVRPWLHEVLELFGPHRCLAGGNFPVDGVFGLFEELMLAYLTDVGEHGGTPAIDAVFAGNAERIYRV